jgi:hypothetical protein
MEPKIIKSYEESTEFEALFENRAALADEASAYIGE